MSFMLSPLRHWLLDVSDLSADDLFQGSLSTGVEELTAPRNWMHRVNPSDVFCHLCCVLKT